MKARRSLAGIFIAFVSVLSVQAQGFFQNLNFEQATPMVDPNGTFRFDVTTASALPGWTATLGNVQQSDVWFNAVSTGSPEVGLIGPGYNPNFGPAPIAGNYSVLLTGTFGESAAISQTGLIPAGTKSLLFEASTAADAGPPGTLEIQLGTQVIPFAAVGVGANYTLYGANISAWANNTEQLTFSALQDNTALNNWEIDDITFSTNSVTPEPNTLALMLMAVGAYGVRRWRAKEP